VTSLLFDFKGNLLQGERRLAQAYQTQVDWMALAGLVDWTDHGRPDVHPVPQIHEFHDDTTGNFWRESEPRRGPTKW